MHRLAEGDRVPPDSPSRSGDKRDVINDSGDRARGLLHFALIFSFNLSPASVLIQSLVAIFHSILMVLDR